MQGLQRFLNSGAFKRQQAEHQASKSSAQVNDAKKE